MQAVCDGVGRNAGAIVSSIPTGNELKLRTGVNGYKFRHCGWNNAVNALPLHYSALLCKKRGVNGAQIPVGTHLGGCPDASPPATHDQKEAVQVRVDLTCTHGASDRPLQQRMAYTGQA